MGKENKDDKLHTIISNAVQKLVKNKEFDDTRKDLYLNSGWCYYLIIFIFYIITL
jgi:hypothetical protein